MLLVESAQSVANRLEKTCLDGDGPGLDPALDGLPYVAADLDGAAAVNTTSSLVEAHRIGSPYFLLNKDFQNTLIQEMGYNPKLPLDWKKIYAALFKYDANSLVHGVFLSLLEGGRVRAPRAITGFIEAENVRARGLRRRQEQSRRSDGQNPGSRRKRATAAFTATCRTRASSMWRKRSPRISISIWR